MKLLSTRLADAVSFSHLASLGRGKQAKADDKDKDYRDEDDDKKAENDDDEKDAKADDNPGAEDDDDENKKQKSPDGKGKSKRAKAEDDDGDDDDGKKKDDDDSEDDEEEMHGKNAIARARLREQARCAAIMGCRAAGRNVVLAAQLALTTRMTREEAIGVLENTPAAGAVAHGRELRNPRLGGGGEHAMDSAAAVEASWDRAFQKAGAVRRK